MNILALKMGAIEMSSQEHNGDFLQNDYDDSD
jgi:hypothetical protein